MFPLQFGVPGGPELLVIFLRFPLVGLPLLLVVAAVALLSRRGGDGDETDRVEELERRVEELEAELEDERSEGERP